MALRLAARALLAVFSLVCLWLAAAPAIEGSRIVLATAGGSPGWLLGPLRFAGSEALAGADAGLVYYSALLAASAVFAALVWLAPRLSRRELIAAIGGLHLLFLLAPPLLSQDVFSYIAYARLGVEYDLNPYAYRPFDIPGDPVFPFAGSKDAVNVYGPFFTLLTYPLAQLSVPAAFWTLKVIAAAASLALVGLVARTASRVGVNPQRAAVLVGLCPATLVHVVGGAHNEALTMLIVTSGVALSLAGRATGGGAATVAAAGIKASALVPAPFLLAASRDRLRVLTGMAAAAAAIVAAAIAGFGTDALGALNLISSNQDRTSRYSIPHKIVDGLEALSPQLDREAASDVVRLLLVLLLAIAVAWLMRRSYRRPKTAIENIGWATLGVLLASAWLVPWYLLWLLPFTALARSRALTIATLVFATYTLAIAIPF